MRLLFLPALGLIVGVSLSLQAHAGTAAIASAHPLATQAGFQILQQGGNAFDAAVAVTAALAVVEPAGSGLGGGGFWLLHRAADQHDVLIDGRETAPSAAHPGYYLDANGVLDRSAAIDGARAAAIPGSPAAIVYLAEQYGQLPLATSLAPAITLAEQGFPVSEQYRWYLQRRLAAVQASAEASRWFLDAGSVPEVGFQIVQTDLANTLRALAEQGRDGFYTGVVAQRLVDGVRAAGGDWTMGDLADYQLQLRPVTRLRLDDTLITTSSLPSAGGVVLSLALQQLHQLEAAKQPELTRLHLLIEALKRAYRERLLWLADPDFSPPPAHLAHPNFAAQLATSIARDAASQSDTLAPDLLESGENTTHFSIIDAQGNRVAATMGINYFFGSGFMPAGTGVLLNNEMDDFVIDPANSPAFARTGSVANQIEPGKRPLSSMTPVFVENADRLMVLGTPGGSRIMSMLVQAVLGFEQGLSFATIAHSPRLHHGFLPDVVQVESEGFSAALLADLQALGHTIERLDRQYGNLQIVGVDKRSGEKQAVSDPRGEGGAWVEHISPQTSSH